MLWNLPSIKLKIGLWRQLGETADVGMLPISTPSLTIRSCVEIRFICSTPSTIFQGSRMCSCPTSQWQLSSLQILEAVVGSAVYGTHPEQIVRLTIHTIQCVFPFKRTFKVSFRVNFRVSLARPQWASSGRPPLKIFVRSAFPLQQLVLDLSGKSKDLAELKEQSPVLNNYTPQDNTGQKRTLKPST